jgi:hypothetical protein
MAGWSFREAQALSSQIWKTQPGQPLSKWAARHSNQLQRIQILDQIVNLRITETESEEAVVVLHDIVKSCETPVVVEPAFRVCPESLQGSCTVTLVRRPIRLKIINADFGS